MGDFLSTLANRNLMSGHTDPAASVLPRLPARFEPSTPGAPAPMLGHADEPVSPVQQHEGNEEGQPQQPSAETLAGLLAALMAQSSGLLRPTSAVQPQRVPALPTPPHRPPPTAADQESGIERSPEKPVETAPTPAAGPLLVERIIVRETGRIPPYTAHEPPAPATDLRPKPSPPLALPAPREQSSAAPPDAATLTPPLSPAAPPTPTPRKRPIADDTARADAPASLVQPAHPPLRRPAPAVEPGPTIQVTIGRIEVRATPAPAPANPERRPAPVMSLADYLRQRAQATSGGDR